MKLNTNHLGESILKKKIYILLMTIVFAVTGVFYTLTNVKCISTQKILMRTSGDINMSQIYKEFIKGSTILEKVIKNLNSDITIEELANSIEVHVINQTNMIEIEVYGTDSETTQKYVNEISKVFIETVNEVYDNQELYNVNSTSNYYTNGNYIKIGIISAILGFILSCLFFIICCLLDIKIKSPKDIEDITDLRTLISIPNEKLIDKKRLNIKNIRLHKSEIFKKLMTNIQFIISDNLDSKSILITSVNPFEGKTYVSTNLAIEFAKVGKKVILIDSDMRRGNIAKIYNLPNDLGFSNYLANLDENGNVIHDRITRFIKDTEIKNLSVITSGNIPPNPSELLKEDKLEELIKDLKVFYDVVLFDGVSILEATEAMILSKECDLSLVLSSYGNTKKEDLGIAYEALEYTTGSVISVGLNKIPEKKLSKKINYIKNNLIQKMKSLKKNLKKLLIKFGIMFNVFHEIAVLFKVIIGTIIYLLNKLKEKILELLKKLRKKLYDIKENIKAYMNKNKKVKLINAGNATLSGNSSNTKEILKNEIEILGLEDNTEYREKLDNMKMNIEEKTAVSEFVEEISKPRPVAPKRVNVVKSKFDLIREQQAKEDLENNAEENIQLDFNDMLSLEDKSKKMQEERREAERREAERREAERREAERREAERREAERREAERREAERREAERREAERREVDRKKAEKKNKIEEYQDVDLGKEKYLTEEMIRKQVEMDEMIREAEREKEEEIYKMQQMKLIKKLEKRQGRKERFESFIDNFKAKREEKNKQNKEKLAILKEKRIRKNEAKMEEKMRKQKERNENRERMAKIREERKAYREMEKKKHREEMRIKEELHDDNLYPKPKM